MEDQAVVMKTYKMDSGPGMDTMTKAIGMEDASGACY